MIDLQPRRKTHRAKDFVHAAELRHAALEAGD